MVETYQRQRPQEQTYTGQARSTAEVNQTIAMQKRMSNLAVREDLAPQDPCWKVTRQQENNARDRASASYYVDDGAQNCSYVLPLYHC
jgi:hypothetical protein